MAEEEEGGRVYGRLLEVHTKLGQHDAQITALNAGARDTNDNIRRLGDRFEKQIAELQHSVKSDIDSVGSDVKQSFALLIKELREVTSRAESERGQLLTSFEKQQQSSIERTLAKHWKIVMLGVVALCAAVFGAGLQSGKTGVMPVALDLMRGTN